MAKKPAPRNARRSAVKKVRQPTSPARPLLDAADVRTLLVEQANRIAPADVTELMSAEEELRRRAGTGPAKELPLLHDQLNLALDCLRDHVDGVCPQIPYYTISLLAAAVSYFADELDVIPDFLPDVGRLDDGAVMAMACRLGEEGLRRYCDWRGRDCSALLGPRGGRARQ